MRNLLFPALAATALHAAVIRGVVVENQTGKPLMRTVVTLRPMPGTPGGELTARTNAYGIFDFPPVAGGAYLVSAARRNFASIQYGQKDWKSAGQAVVLDETASAFLNIRLPRLGAITGRVVDENDVGLPNHDVAAYRNTRPPQLITRVTADERGIYRIFGLEPGSYLVRTIARLYEEGSYVPTFSKDTAAVEEARPVEVLLDQEAGNVDVRPAQGRLLRIGGEVRPGLKEANGSPVTVRVTLASDTGRETVSTSGSFHFAAVPPGQYELYAEGPGNDSANCYMLGGYLPQPMTDQDQTRIQLAAPCVRETQLQVVEKNGQPVDSGSYRILARRKDAAGTGEIQRLAIGGTRYNARIKLAPGRWELMAIPPAGYCVLSFGYSRQSSEGVEPARADGWNEIMAGSNYNPVRFVFSKSPGAVHGAVSGMEHEAVAGAPVFLEGYDAENHKRLTELRVAYTDPRGQYQFTGLTPGSYRLLSTFEFRSPDAAAMERAGARAVKVDEAGDIAQDLDLWVIR